MFASIIVYTTHYHAVLCYSGLPQPYDACRTKHKMAAARHHLTFVSGYYRDRDFMLSSDLSSTSDRLSQYNLFGIFILTLSY